MHAGLHIYCSHATKLGFLATRCINEYKILYNKSEFCLLKYWLRFFQLKEWTGVCYHPDFATTTVIVRFCPVSVSELSHRVDLLNLGMVGVILSTIVRVQFPDDSSIFTAEAKAIDLALDFISTCDASNKFIIFSDSLSVLKAMNHTSSKNPQIQKLLEKCHELLAYKEIALCWIPSHIGIQGNEMVDKQAKTSLSLEPTSFKIPFSNFKPSINKYILEECQTSWNNSIGNKLLDIKPTIGEYQSVVRNIRREEVVLARLRLGHTRVTHSHLLQGEEQPQCVGCDAPFTVRHFLLECGDFAQVRNNCFHVNNMKELFQDIHIDSIMTFLRQINLFNKI